MNTINSSTPSLQTFKDHVALKFQLYNGIFTSLPFDRIEKTGILLSLLLTHCEDGYNNKQDPRDIIESFFEKQVSGESDEDRKINMLFRFVQYVERQIVLFDALEDASFAAVNDMNGKGTLKQLLSLVETTTEKNKLSKKLKNFAIRLVLTAHPTQFYPGPVLGIINDLSKAITSNNVRHIEQYLNQLGKTPFFKKQKPTPYDEAVSLLWYMENVFYQSAGQIVNFMKTHLALQTSPDHALIRMGFWPGGDRDGNPFVNADITLKVADLLRGGIIKCYYMNVRKLKRRLTFNGVDTVLAALEKKLYDNIFIPHQRTSLTQQEIIDDLNTIHQLLLNDHNSLFIRQVEELIAKVEIFGLFFASLDIRQESTIHGNVLNAIAKAEPQLLPEYQQLDDKQKSVLLLNCQGNLDAEKYTDPLVHDTIKTIKAVKTIQAGNGEEGCNRYIISQCNSALNVLEVYGLFMLSGWSKQNLPIDIVPLFETVVDLKDAASIMQQLYEDKTYKAHLKQRNNKQTIMLGFSDGTKDGGYLMANWSIYKAKEELSYISRQYGIEVLFFDGRGGPPARGGGKTHNFYASTGRNIANQEIQLTIQGQTVSSNFGTIDAAQYNIEQLINAGLSNSLLANKATTLTQDQEDIIAQMANESFKSYIELKEHPAFVDYMAHISPLRFYSETNIGSRPAKRGASGKLSLKDLRAIPFVGAWSQIKQNVTGYYGVGTALEKLYQEEKGPELETLYSNSLFFKTLMDNCEMAMQKCFFPLTAYLSQDIHYGQIWQMIYKEYELTKTYVLKLSGKTELMADYPVENLSIHMRDRIVLPLITIQQYALANIRDLEDKGDNTPLLHILEKLVIRTSFGIINAARNSA